jgi:hypothetical protein
MHIGVHMRRRRRKMLQPKLRALHVCLYEALRMYDDTLECFRFNNAACRTKSFHNANYCVV